MRIQTRFTTLTLLCSVMLIVWLSFASVSHQFDFNSEHHEQHHCQLFAGVQHGLKSQPVFPSVTPHLLFELKVEQDDIIQLVTPFSRARSPPLS